MPNGDLEAPFHKEMQRIYTEASTFGYYPTRFLVMLTERGGVTTAKSLLNSSTISEGFTRLWIEGRLDLSVEAVVLHPQWRTLFTADELATAQIRLDGVNYMPPAGR